MKMLPVATLAMLVLVGPLQTKAKTPSVQYLGTPNAAIADMVIVPPGYEAIYISGMRCSGRNEPRTGDTKTQTINTLLRMKKLLEEHGFSMGDVVMLRVFLASDPAKGGAYDIDGMSAGYSQFFGAPDQPIKPSRTTIRVNDMGDGSLVEIDAQLAHKPH